MIEEITYGSFRILHHKNHFPKDSLVLFLNRQGEEHIHHHVDDGKNHHHRRNVVAGAVSRVSSSRAELLLLLDMDSSQDTATM